MSSPAADAGQPVLEISDVVVDFSTVGGTVHAVRGVGYETAV